MPHDYIRNGTISLFAACDLASGYGLGGEDSASGFRVDGQGLAFPAVQASTPRYCPFHCP